MKHTKTGLFAITIAGLTGWTVLAQPTIVDLGVLPGQAASYGNAISADGSAVTGASGPDSGTISGKHAFRWTAAGGLEDLGIMPGGSASWGQGISGDGSVVTGFSRSANGTRAFRWTAADGMQDLGVPAWAEVLLGEASFEMPVK